MFTLDKYYLLINKEKTLINRIFTSDNEFIEARLSYDEKLDRKTYDTLLIPTLNISKWNKNNSEVWISKGLGLDIKLGESVKRRSIKNLEKLAKNITDEYILSLANKNDTILNDDCILA